MNTPNSKSEPIIDLNEIDDPDLDPTPDEQSPKMTRMIAIPNELHRQLKFMAMHLDITIRQATKQALEMWLAEMKPAVLDMREEARERRLKQREAAAQEHVRQTEREKKAEVERAEYQKKREKVAAEYREINRKMLERRAQEEAERAERDA